MQTYVYSLLQSLHLVPPCSLPGVQLLIPSAEQMHLPPLPTELSLRSASNFGLGLLTAPPILVYLSLYFRPVVEMRLYKLIRRRLPKPTHADEVSIKVALDNDLIDWMVPSLGRKSEEEISRSRLTLVQDLLDEAQALKTWALWWFGLRSSRRDSDCGASSPQSDQRIESLRNCVEELQNELNATQSRTRPPQQQSTQPQDTSRVQMPEPDPAFHGSRVLSNEENRISQSPDEMSAGELAEMEPLRRATSIAPVEPANREVHRGDDAHPNRRNSRSDTLFSRPSSPESSPPTSPRVRASLIHQNSEIITMQLELLSRRDPNNQNQPALQPGDQNQNQRSDQGWTPADQQSIAEFLDNLISNQGPNLAALINSDTVDSDGLSGLTAGVSPAARDNQADPVDAVPENPAPDSPAEPPVVRTANILPDDVEEPGPELAHNQPDAQPTLNNPAPLEPLLPPTTTTQNPHHPSGHGGPHRVTILSSHPLDSLASRLASVITGVMFIPLDSLYLRSLASSYLSSRGASSALGSDVRALSVWPGGGSMSGTLPYLGKLGLVLGIQAAVNASVWGIVTGTAIRIGRSFCGWGKL